MHPKPSPVPPCPFPRALAPATERLLPPGQPANSLAEAKDAVRHLPGEPSIALAAPAARVYLADQLATPVIDELYTRMWIVARPSGDSIEPLSRHYQRGRVILATHELRLHLVRTSDAVFIKRLPRWLLNSDVWESLLAPTPQPPSSHGAAAQVVDASPSLAQETKEGYLRAAALGFLRSYGFLIQTELDFILAREAYLLPSELSWPIWAPLVPHLLDISDDSVSRRFRYGQLRLTRLNWAVRLFQPPSAETVWFYDLPRLGSTASYLKEMSIPLLFIFAALSLALSSMQVILSADLDTLLLSALDELAIRRAFVVCSLILLAFSLLVFVLMIFIPAGVLMWQLSWGFSNRQRNAKYHV